MNAQGFGAAPGRDCPEAVGMGLNRVAIHTLTDPRTGMQVRLEQPAHSTTWRPRADLLRHRGVAYDRLSGDLVPSSVPEGYLGVVGAGEQKELLTRTAVGLPQPHGEHGWVYCHRTISGLVHVSARKHAAGPSTDWGSSTRSLLGLRSRTCGQTRLWALGPHTIWLRREHSTPEVLVQHSAQDGPWPDAQVRDLYCAAACTVMVDDAPLPGLPQGVVVTLEAKESLVLGLAAGTEELAAFLREDHVAHYVVPAPAGGRSPELGPVGDLPRGSVAHQDTCSGREVVYTERLEDCTISYTVEDGGVIAAIDEPVSHYTGVPGLNGAWVEARRPDTVRWPGGSWSDSSSVEGLLPGGNAERVQVMTGRSRGYQYLSTRIGPGAERPDSSNDAPAVPPPVRDSAGSASSCRVLWVPPTADPVAGAVASVITRAEGPHLVEIIAGDSVREALPLVWFDSSWTVPSMPAHRTRVDLGSMPVGSAQWCHAASRPVIRVGIDYEALARTSSAGIIEVLRDAWDAALAAVHSALPMALGTPYLGGHSFGAALAAVTVLHGVADPAGAILRSGAYDRYATPTGFEHDRRTIATDPDLYRLMTVVPRAGAHRGVPFLLTCGECDENSVTTPRQSLVLYDNLAAWGADATFAVLPGEGHELSSRPAALRQRQLEGEWMTGRACMTPLTPDLFEPDPRKYTTER